MTASIASRIMDELAVRLTGIPNVQALFLDSARVVSRPDGLVVTLDLEGAATDEIAQTCQLDSTLPVVVSVYSNRVPNDPPNWQILDPVYVEIHSRMMQGNRTLGGLALDIKARRREYVSELEACALRCSYDVSYRTSQSDVTTP